MQACKEFSAHVHGINWTEESRKREQGTGCLISRCKAGEQLSEQVARFKEALQVHLPPHVLELPGQVQEHHHDHLDEVLVPGGYPLGCSPVPPD